MKKKIKTKDTVSLLKKDIQKQLRLNAIARDKTCVIGQNRQFLPSNWINCGPLRKDGQIIVQAEHLCGRTKSSCYADMNNIVLLCMRHHFYFKEQRGALYWAIIRKHIGEERWGMVQAWEKDNAIHKFSKEQWQQSLTSLKTQVYN